VKIADDDYAVLYDVIERAWHHEPVQPSPGESFHTSSYAREAANRIVEELGLEVEVEK
jgi:hypothetical protein